LQNPIGFDLKPDPVFLQHELLGNQSVDLVNGFTGGLVVILTAP